MNELCRNGHPPRLAAWLTPAGPRCDACLGYSPEEAAFRMEIEFTDFGDYGRFGIRDVAAMIEDCAVMSVGGTHLAMTVMDYRDPFDNTSVFMPLIAALGKAQIAALS